jgi:hypothetical protein
VKTRFQRGLTLFWVAIGSALLALVAMAVLYSMRHERNLLAEGAAAVASNAGAAKVVELAASARADGGLRRCVVNGKTIVSNSEADCAASNPTSKKIDMVIPQGVVTPKQAEPAASAPASKPAVDKIIEKQLQ